MSHQGVAKRRAIDFGIDPPLLLGERRPQGPVSWRWLLGAVVTGVAGMLLVGGALYSSVDGAVRFAEPVDGLDIEGIAALGTGLGDRYAASGKSDRLDAIRTRAAVREVIQTSSVTQLGDKEFIRLKPYIRVTAPFSLALSGVGENLPAFNPMRIYSEAGLLESGAPETAAAEERADAQEITTVTRPFNEADVTLDETVVLAEDEIEAALDAAAPFEATLAFELHSPLLAATMAVQQASTTFDVEAPREDLGGGFARNVTTLPKTAGGAGQAEIRLLDVKKGDTLASILNDNGVEQDQAERLLAALAPQFRPGSLKVGQQIRVAFSADTEQAGNPMRLSVLEDGDHVATVARAGDGDYIMLDSPEEPIRAALPEETAALAKGPRPSLYRSLYETGIRSEIPKPLLDEIVRVASYDVEFQKAVAPGDMLEVFYEAPEAGSGEDRLQPLFVALDVRGTKRAFYRFRTPDDGLVDYYDHEGVSAKKFLIRKPMEGGVFRSSFGMRRHPILGYKKMHTGVDWSAPRGTPVLAAGEGVVQHAKRNSGYGNQIVIRHANGYETSYSHLSGFAKGVQAGGRVRQGQVIGYVGSTGLSTGPHLHYEVLVNARHVDPMRIRLPRGRTLQGRILAAFEREKARIDQLMNSNPAATTVADSAGTLVTRR
jgi:murein DD-endopeptidase MepM/ murein hydrolase activator NlpD